MDQEDRNTSPLFWEACQWLGRIEACAPEDLIAFDEWLCASARHVQQVIELQALICQSRRTLEQEPHLARSRQRSGDKCLEISTLRSITKALSELAARSRPRRRS